jgi:hypothetical protein
MMTIRKKVLYAVGTGQRWNRAFNVAKESYCLHATATDMEQLSNDATVHRENMRRWRERYPHLARELAERSASLRACQNVTNSYILISD